MSLKRERLLTIINRALNAEEETVQTATRNITVAIDFLENDASVKDKVRSIMKQLSHESTGHAKILHELKDTIMKEEKNVY